MKALFDNLLVSSPNGGGVFFTYEGKVFQLDQLNTTGLSVKGRTILRGVQPSSVYIYTAALGDFKRPIDDIHDVYIDNSFYYFVGTSENEIIKADETGEEVQRWKFPGEKDALHINCVAIWNGRLVFSAFGDFKEHRGYKGRTARSGFVQELITGRRLISELSQPHSLVPIGNNLLLANSEYKEISEYGPSGELVRTLTLDGYTRGICVTEETIYIGLSCSRNIASNDSDTATIVAIDRESWTEHGRLSLPAKEIYSIQEINISDVTWMLANIASTSTFKLSAQIADLSQAISDRDGQIAGLSQAVSDRDVQIASLNQIVCDRDRELSNLNQLISQVRAESQSRSNLLERIEGTYSWRLTRPLRGAARALVRNRDDFYRCISWTKFLFTRSKAVIRHQGMQVFFHRAARYTNAFWRRRLASLRTRGITSFAGLSEAADDGSILVSFVIPVYDRTDVLRIAINSALNQTVRDIEVIIVTDGSPKETIDVVNEFAGNERVRIFGFPRSSGNAVRGRNKGISEARGRYVAFLDSDDIAVPDRLERCLPILENGEADVVYGSWRAIVDGSRDIPGITNDQIVFSPNADLKMLLEVCVPCQSTVIVRKSLFDLAGLLKPTMQYREDHELWARLAFYGGVFRSLPDVLTCLRLHSGNNELNFKDTDDHWFNCVQSEYRISGPKPKKIAFLLPGVGISGGIAVVFKHAELLMKAGHDAFVINVGDMGEGDWFPNNPVPIVHISDPRLYLFRGIEMLFATGWSTAEWLDRLPAVRKLYFVQSDERRFFDDEALRKKIHETYQIQCEYLTEALWIKRMLREEFGHEAAYVPNGLDPKQFFPDIPLAPKVKGKLRVLLEGPIVIPFKGMADSYAAVQGLDCEVWIVSSAGKPPADWKYDRFFEGVPFGEMGRIYSSCDIFLKMSRIEGFFGPPMEAMACGCSVVVGKVTGYDEYIEDEVNALVVEQGDVLAARRAVERLIADDALRQRLIRGGLNTISDWSWERSTQSMLELVNGEEIKNQERQIHLSKLGSTSSH